MKSIKGGQLSFSQRKGYKPVASVIQREEVSDDLRNALWNALTLFWSSAHLSRSIDLDKYIVMIWIECLKRPVDEVAPPHVILIWDHGLALLRKHFFSCAWYELYDFLEYTLNYYSNSKLPKAVNQVLERELSGYRFLGTAFTDVTDEHEIAEVERALADPGFPGVRGHLEQALHLLGDRKNPDYRNSIKESISAVESMAQVVAGKPSATLGDALRAIEKSGKLHPSLKAGFEKLYGYTNDGDGIRHAMQDEPNLTAADARYFLIACSAFVNYLKAKV